MLNQLGQDSMLVDGGDNNELNHILRQINSLKDENLELTKIMT